MRRLRLSLSVILAATACFAWPQCVAAGSDGGSGPNSPFQIEPPVDSRAFLLSAGATEPAPDESASAAPETLLMKALDQVGIGKWMTDNRINAFGWIEGSYNYNFENPAPRLNLGHLFDVQDSDAVINQLQLSVERTVDLSTKPFDLGGRIDLLYGSDARFLHSSDLLDHQGGQDLGVPSQQYQFDIPQLYVDVALPVGSGLRLRFGKFEFFKFTDPNASPLFSHSYFYSTSGEGNVPRVPSSQVGASVPFTLTGITGYYEFSKQVNLEAGIGRGYDQSLTDNNGSIDGFGRLNYTVSDRTTTSFAVITGSEITGDNSHYRTVGVLSVGDSVTNDLLILADAFYGVQARGQTLFDPATTQLTHIGGDAHWYGLNGTAIYRINRNLSAAARFEWYRDEQGFTTGYGKGVNLYEVTTGLTITPFPDSDTARGFKIRPEIRYDFSDKPYFLNTSARSYQWIAAVDAIFNF
jgi:hypothetical protein